MGETQLTLGKDGWLRGTPGAVAHFPTVRTRKLAAEGVLGLVWHATGGVGGPRFAEGLARRIQSFERGVNRAASWHFLVSRGGVIYQSAPTTVGTWHVGCGGTLGGTWCPSVNAVSLGVELENAGPLTAVGDRFYAWPVWLRSGDRGRQPDRRCRVSPDRAASFEGRFYDDFPEAQVAAATGLVKALASGLSIGRESFTYAHADFAAPRKVDPGPLWMRGVLPRVLDAVFGGAAGGDVAVGVPVPAEGQVAEGQAPTTGAGEGNEDERRRGT